MRPLDGILDELDDLAQQFGIADLREAPPKDDKELVDPAGVPFSKRGQRPGSRKPTSDEEPGDEPDDDVDDTPKTSPAAKARTRFDRAKDFAHDVLRALNLRGAESTSVGAKSTRVDGREGSAITMWDTEHNILVSVFVDDDGRGKARAMKVEKKEGEMRQGLDLSDEGFDRAAREVASFVRGL
jgi:hypothetical protein